MSAGPSSELLSKSVGDLQPLMTPDELAHLLGVSKRTIWRLPSGKRLPEPLRIGGSVRWRREQIDRWIEEGCPPARRIDPHPNAS